MKNISIILLSLLTTTLAGQVAVGKASSSGITSAESLRQELIAGKTRIGEVIAPWQKEKQASVIDKLRKTRLSASSTSDPVDLVKSEVKRVFYRLTDKQTDFFTAYVFGSFFSSDSQAPEWVQNTLQKEQHLIQMLSNVSKMMNDEGLGTIHKIGCSGSECDD